MSTLLNPRLLAYQQDVLAMRHSSFIAFLAHVLLETMAKRIMRKSTR